MGKHGNTHKRVERDFYPTPAWVTYALAVHVPLAGKCIWEPAAGDGHMAKALRALGAKVYCSDVHLYGFPLDELLDFTSPKNAGRDYDLIVTNPPGGPRNQTAVQFIEAGLSRLHGRRTMALLLPATFESGITRARFFRDCPLYRGKIVLLNRVVWYPRSDGVREAPKENYDWHLWGPGRGLPTIRYATDQESLPSQIKEVA